MAKIITSAFIFLSLGKLEALAILLQKLRSESRRVLIFTQMLKMLDILEAFLDYRQLTYMRIDERLTYEERQVKISPTFYLPVVMKTIL